MLTAACGDDTEEPEHCDVDHDHDQRSCDPGQHLGSPSQATCQDDSTLTYGNFAKNFFAKYCTRCHSEAVQGSARMLAPADHNFDTLAEVELLKAHIDQVAAA